MKLRVGLIQMLCEKNSIDQNIETTIDYINQAIEKNIGVICFPEMNITGFSDPIKYPKMKIAVDGPEVSKIVQFSKHKPITIIIGIIEDNGKEKPFITQIVIQSGKIISTYRKITIDEDEVQWFSPGRVVQPFLFNNIETGLTICADISNEKVFEMYAKKGVKLIFELAAPGLYGEQTTRDWESGYMWWKNECNDHFGKYSQKYSLWIFVATQAGRTIDEDFPGGAYIFNPKGERIFSTDNWAIGPIFVEVDLVSSNVKLL